MKIEDLPGMWTAYSQRWSERDDRMSLMADVIAGDWGLVADDGLEVENRSPNLIQVGVEDTAEAAAYVPSTRVDPSGSTKRKQEQADAMERMAVGYWDRSNMELLNVHNMLDLAAYGFFVNVAVMDERTGTPYAQRRDPRTCFPEPGWSPMDTTKRVMFAREVYLTQLPEEWQWKFYQDEATPAPTDALWQRDYKVTLVEFYDDTEYVVGGLYRSNNVAPGGNTRSYTPVEFHREDHGVGECPVVVGQRITLDGDPRGQFDQAINVMAAHIRLMGTVMDYADQSVYCLSPEARVLTENLEYVEVGKLEVGDRLVGFDEHPGTDPTAPYRMWRRSEVLAAERKMLPSYRVKMADGTEFTASVQHKWLTGNSGNTSEWIDTAELDRRFHTKHGARVIKPMDAWEHDRSWESGYLAGVLDGEGWLTASNRGSFRMGIAQRDNACLKMTEDALAHLGFDYSKSVVSSSEDNPGGPVYNLQILGGMREIIRLLMTVRPERLIDKFHALGGAEYMGRFKRHEMVDVVECEFVGTVEVVALATSTKTLIAEGYAHHNSDVWVKDLIGEMSVGGGGYIQLGPNGAIGRVAPAVTSFSVFEQLSQLVDGVHLGGRWPKTRPGDIDQAIASGKFLETSAAMMNTAIRTMHLIAKRAYERLLSIMFKLDAVKGRDRVVTGVLSNQKFRYERKLADIDLNARIRVEYGAALGRDQAQATVMGIQMGQAGLVSNEFVQENIEGITDVAKERSRIDVEKLRDMAFARLMQGLESGEVPLKALTEIAKARAAGAQIIELFDEYLVKPQEEMQAQQLTSGLTGEAMMPGLPPMPGAMPPAPPGPEELLGGELATIGRTSVPLGNGSFAGVESRG